MLVRHAPTSWSGRRYCGVSDPALDAAGRVVAAQVAAGVVGRLPAGRGERTEVRVVSSPRRRAVETADAIRAALGARTGPLVVDDRWAEADFGVAEGATFDELEVAAPALARRLAAGETAIDWPDGETAVDLHGRVAAAWRDAAALAQAGHHVVVVSHAGPIRDVLAALEGRLPGDVRLPEPGEILIVPAS